MDCFQLLRLLESVSLLEALDCVQVVGEHVDWSLDLVGRLSPDMI